MPTKLSTTAVLLAMALAACGASGANTAPTTSEGFLQGVVHDAQGRALEGVQIFADHTQYYNTNAIGVSDAGGKYRIDVRQPVGSWHATAQLKRSFNGKNYTFALAPDNDNPFAGVQGAVRNFEWKLSGPRLDGLGNYGGLVTVYKDYGNFNLVMSEVEITLTPVGPLVDGSIGQTITRKLVLTGDGDGLEDVPVGRYSVTARYVPAGEAPRPLVIRLRDQGSYQSSLTADFAQYIATQMMVLQVNE